MDGGNSCRPKIEHVWGDGISAIPRPLKSLQGTPVPPFLSKTYDLVDDDALDPIISWGPTGASFVVWDPMDFSRTVLPLHFKHNNFSSFARQLNTYGFRKIGTDRWEFANEDFQRGKKALLKHINRRRSYQAHQMCSLVGSSGEMGNGVVESEVQKMKREKDLLMQEVTQLRKEQLNTVEKMNSINHRMKAAELKQRQMVSFLAKVLQNPTFIGHLMHLNGQKEIASGRGKRKFIKHHHQQTSTEPTNQRILKYTESDEGSDALLCVFEHNEGDRIPTHLPKDIADKLDLDTGGGEASFGGSDESKNLKGKNILSPQMDSEFPGSDYFVPFPDDIGAWNVCLEVGGGRLLSSEPAVWDDGLGREMEAAVGSCSVWDLDFNVLEEDLDIVNYMGGESSLQEHKDDSGWPNADGSMDLEP